MATKTVGFAVSDQDLEDLEELVEYFANGNRSAYLRQTIKVMKSVMLAERLRAHQTYGAQKSAELGISPDDIPALVRRVLEGRE